ncbi:MAG TPA: ABC transporter permease subunit [Ilumatobacter sp.]|nr:ABC transporter permease subunit [Ilumatobacter sp.]
MRFLAGATPRSAGMRLGLFAFCVALGYLVLVPLYRLQELAFEDGASGYERAWSTRGIGKTLATTVMLALGSLLIALVLGVLLAWAATRLPPKLRLMRVLPIFPIIVPSVASVTGWAFLFSPRPGYLNALMRNLPWWNHLDEGPVDVYTLPWIIILTGFGLTSFVYMFVNSGFQNIGAELIEAGHVSGSRGLGVFFKVILPLLRPTIVYGGGVALLLGLGQFTGPLLLGRNTGVTVLTTQMYFKISTSPVDYGAAAAIGSPLLLFGVAVVIFQKVILGDQARFVTHAGKSSFRSDTRPSKLAVVAISLYSFVAMVLPIGALVIVALSPFWSADIEWGRLSLENFREVLGSPNMTEAITNSVLVSLLAVAIAIPIGFVAANLILRGRKYKVMRTFVDFLVSMPLGIPAVVFGVGFLLAYTQEPIFLYATRWVILLVYITVVLPFTTRMQLAGMIALGDSYLEASRVSGASALKTNIKIVLPLMRSSIAGAAALMFVLLTHEFAASLLVRSPSTNVMGTVLFDYYTNGSYPTVAAIALIMTGVTTIGVTAAVMMGGTKALEGL